MKSESVGAVVVTDRDIALAVANDDDLSSAGVESVMTEDPVTIHEDEVSMALSRAIDEHHVRRFPVVDDGAS